MVFAVNFISILVYGDIIINHSRINEMGSIVDMGLLFVGVRVGTRVNNV